MGEVAAAAPAQVAGVISDCKAEQNIPHTLTCRVLGVSESWFYKWRLELVTAREVRRGELADAIGQVFDESGGTYGSPKIWVTLVRQGWRVSVNTVAKLMAELGLAGRRIRRRGGLTRPGKRPAFADFVRRDFTADAPDQVWAGDMTEIATSEGKLYLATVIDLFSRRMLGYAMGERHDADLVVASLNMAAATRGGDVRGVIFHSDRGSEGGFNWSSQHLTHRGGCCGTGKSAGSASGRPAAVAVTWATAGQSEATAAGVLEAGRRGPDQRGRGYCVWSITSIGHALVP
ncbi:IS3 family transposase [Streptomyces sp. NBC_01800]|nr:IS3 family transposase [Streptomyces sp. NBC_01800]WSA73335.1 IS3 family transposase [Streptomyces sp. NBC_01800]